MLYASSDPQNQPQAIDPNAYQPFKLLDSTVVSRISHELDHLSQEEGPHGLVININSCSSMYSPLRACRCLDKSLVLYSSPLFPFIIPVLTLPFRHQSDIHRLLYYRTQPCRRP